MPATPYTARAKADGTCTVTIQLTKSGVQWVVAQIGAETQPFRSTAQVTMRKNGGYLTSSATLPASSGGNPAILMQGMDTLTFDFVGMTLNDTAVVTLYYVESLWGTIPNGDVV
jgi:hypothetical protein